MAQADGEVIVDTRIQTKGIEDGSRDINSCVKKLASSVSQFGEKVQLAFDKQANSIIRMNNQYVAQEAKVAALRAKVEELKEQQIPTEEYAEYQKQCENAEKKLNRLKAAQDKFNKTNGNVDSSRYKSLQYDIQRAEREIEAAQDAMQDMEKCGTAFAIGINIEKVQAAMQKLEAEEAKLESYGGRIRTALDEMAYRFDEVFSKWAEASEKVDLSYYSEEILEVSEAQEEAGNKASFFGTLLNGTKTALLGVAHVANRGTFGTWDQSPLVGIKNALINIKQHLETVFKAVCKVGLQMAQLAGRGVIGGLKKLSAGILGINKSVNKTSGTFGTSLKSIIKYTIGIRSLYTLFNKLKSAVKEGLDNLVQYSDKVKQSVSSVTSSTKTLKNSLAAAFAPILNAAAPALTTLIQLLTKATNAVGMFVAALTGQETYTKAVDIWEDYAASLSDTASSAKDAAEATEDYLSPLDDVNKYNNPSSSGTGSSALSPSEMFETVEISSSIKGMAKKLKNLLKKEDWAGLGEYVADRVNKGMQKVYDLISWDTVGPKVTYFVNAFTQAFNSFADNINWRLLGRTLGTGLNTAVNTLNGLITGINWKSLGTGLSEGFRGLLDEVDWTNLGSLLCNRFMISWNILDGFVTDMFRQDGAGLTGWQQLGKALAEAFNGAFGGVDYTTIGLTLSNGLNGLAQSIQSFTGTVDWHGLAISLTNGFNSFITNTDWAFLAASLSGFVIQLLGGIATAIENTDWRALGESVKEFLCGIDWNGIADALFEAIGAALGGLAAFLWGTIKDAWDDVVQWWYDTAYEDGKFTIQGLLEGICQVLVNIGDWIYDHIFAPFIDGFKKAFGIHSPSTVMQEMGSYIIDGLLAGLKNNIDKVISWFRNVKAWVLGEFDDSEKWLVKSGNSTLQGFADGMERSRTSRLENTLKETTASMKSAFNNSSEWASVGGNICDGISSGIDSNRSRLQHNISKLSQDLLQNAKNALGIHSPSRLFRDEVGYFLGLGVAEGMEASEPEILDAVSAVTDDMADEMNNADNALSVRAGIDQIDSILDSFADRVCASFANMTARMEMIAQGMNLSIPTGNMKLPNLSTPYLAQGTIVPQNAKKANNYQGESDVQESMIRRVIQQELSGYQGNTYKVNATVSRKVLFDLVIEEGKMRQGQTGRNDFELK